MMIAILVVTSTTCIAQMSLDSESITGLDIQKGDLEMTLDFQMISITNGIVGVLTKEAKNNLTLATDLLTFKYSESDKEIPSELILDGNVSIDSAQLNITSEKCVIDTLENIAVFTGDVKFHTKGENKNSGSGSKVIIDMNKNTISIKNTQLKMSTSETK
jgi:lipopolysaccharide assembly outer membrane protein LptD (OstA)